MHNSEAENNVIRNRNDMPDSRENKTSAPKNGADEGTYLRIQVFLLSRTSMGKISRRPASISKQSTSLENAL